jgi:GT2 family glycosyltransferase
VLFRFLAGRIVRLQALAGRLFLTLKKAEARKKSGKSPARLVVIIPTLGRGGLVTRLLAHLEGQSRLPDEVILSAPDETHIEALRPYLFPVRTIFGKTGLAAQRNNALRSVLGRFGIVTFFDDDFIPADDYLEGVGRAFEEHQDWVVVMGRVARDGACTAGLDWEEGLFALHVPERNPPTGVADHVGAYGCNMSIRAGAIGDLRFDERLPLYGWQEDIDFTSQLRSRGHVVRVNAIRGVHLGAKSGRINGMRFGYSQVANPLYLIRKGTVPARFAMRLMFRNIAANLGRSLWPETYIDRRGRLYGNLLAIFHLLAGRIEPEYILRMPK